MYPGMSVRFTRTSKYLLKQAFLTIMLLLSALMLVPAQDIVVIGQILSAEDATPLEAANVWFRGTRIGTTTNADGFFMLRSPEPQKVLSVSVIGYRKRNVRLDYGKDQVIEVLMQEESPVLDEIVVVRRTDDAVYDLLRRVRENRHKNNPANIVGITTSRRRTMYANVTNVKGHTFRRRLFNELKSGAIAQTDTNYTLPMYGMRQTEHLVIYPDSVSASVTDVMEDAVSVTETGNWRRILENYLPEIDPYRPYSTILNANFLNPTAPNARTYYNIYFSDSTVTSTGKKYFISFKPKRDEGLLFRGTMAVDSATAAITGIDWHIPSFVPVNFLHNFSCSFEADRLDSVFYTKNEQQFLDLQLVPSSVKTGAVSTVLSNRYDYFGTSLLADTLAFRPVSHLSDSCEDAVKDMEAIWAGIDTINRTRIKRMAEWIVDILLNQHLHIWMIDVGPLLDLYHFNQYEGNTLTLPLRSNRKFSGNFTFGGYYGFGFKDRQHKYGANVRWKFGRGKRNYLAFYYDHRVERYGYDDIRMYVENRQQSTENLFNSLRQIHQYPHHALHKRMKVEYAYEKPGFRFGTEVRAEEILSNRYMPYIQNGREVDKMAVVALKTDFRLSWKEHTLEEYFHRMYMNTKYPVLRFAAEIGGTSVGTDAILYGRLDLYARQNVPVGFGRLSWAVRGSAVVGNVPWPLLHITHSVRSSYALNSDFLLVGQLEQMSDLFCSVHLRYRTRGYIFGYIPGIKRLGIREDLHFKIGYGHLRDGHGSVLALPSMVRPWNNIPYIETGFGFSNFLHAGEVHFLWRVTHRDDPLGMNFGILWNLALDF